MLNVYEVNLVTSGLFSGLVLLALSILVFWHNRANLLNRSFARYAFSVAWWQAFSALMIVADSEPRATFFDKVCLLGVIFIPSTFIHFLSHLFNIANQKRWLVRGVYAFSFLFALLLWTTPWFIKTTGQVYLVKHFSIPGPVYYLYLLSSTAIIFYGFGSFYRQIQATQQPQEKWRGKYLFWWTVLGYIGGSFQYNLVFHIPPYWIVFWSNYWVALYGLALGFGILKYQLLDIHLIIKKSIVYTILITLISVTYVALSFVFERLFTSLVGYNNTLLSIFIILVIVIIFAPLRNKVQDWVDKVFFRRTVLEMMQENEMLRQEIAQAERYKTLAGLTSGIANRIKDPLTTLKAYGHFLKQKRNDEAFVDKFLERHEAEVNRINDLITYLTNYSSPSLPQIQNVNIHKLLQEFLSSLKSQLMASNITLQTRFGGGSDVVFLNIDSSLLRQALRNIITNAIEAMPQGGTLTITTEKTPKDFRISVQDTGVGIPPEKMGIIFDPFFSSEKKDHQGLGLSLAQGIIISHGGRIGLKSTPKEGSEFIISLPLNTL